MTAKQTPLPDLLDQVPEDIVLGIPGDEPVFPSYTNTPIGKHARQAAAELRRLHAENEALRKAYWKMRNSAAGYSNYCDDNANTRRCERDYTEGEAMYRAAIKAVEEA